MNGHSSIREQMVHVAVKLLAVGHMFATEFRHYQIELLIYMADVSAGINLQRVEFIRHMGQLIGAYIADRERVDMGRDDLVASGAAGGPSDFHDTFWLFILNDPPNRIQIILPAIRVPAHL